jgi:hypothetical protein
MNCPICNFAAKSELGLRNHVKSCEKKNKHVVEEIKTEAPVKELPIVVLPVIYENVEISFDLSDDQEWS